MMNMCSTVMNWCRSYPPHKHLLVVLQLHGAPGPPSLLSTSFSSPCDPDQPGLQILLSCPAPVISLINREAQSNISSSKLLLTQAWWLMRMLSFLQNHFKNTFFCCRQIKESSDMWGMSEGGRGGWRSVTFTAVILDILKNKNNTKQNVGTKIQTTWREIIEDVLNDDGVQPGWGENSCL